LENAWRFLLVCETVLFAQLRQKCAPMQILLDKYTAFFVAEHGEHGLMYTGIAIIPIGIALIQIGIALIPIDIGPFPIGIALIPVGIGMI